MPRRGRALVRAVARSPGSGSAKRLAAAAGALGVGVIDREAGVLEAVLVVEGCALEQLGRLGVDDDVDASSSALIVRASPPRVRALYPRGFVLVLLLDFSFWRILPTKNRLVFLPFFEH